MELQDSEPTMASIESGATMEPRDDPEGDAI